MFLVLSTGISKFDSRRSCCLQHRRFSLTHTRKAVEHSPHKHPLAQYFEEKLTPKQIKSRKSKSTPDKSKALLAYDRIFRPEVQSNGHYCRLRWGTVYAMNVDASTVYVAGTRIVVNLNSLYDTMFGQPQPYMFDTLATLYRRYKVTGGRVRLDFNTVSSGPVWYCTRIHAPGDASTIQGNALTDIVERPRTVVKTHSNGAPTQSLEFDFKVWEIAGITKSQFEANIEDYSALVSASPSRIPFMEVAIAGPATTGVGMVTLHVDFDCHFWSPILVEDA